MTLCAICRNLFHLVADVNTQAIMCLEKVDIQFALIKRSHEHIRRAQQLGKTLTRRSSWA